MVMKCVIIIFLLFILDNSPNAVLATNLICSTNDVKSITFTLIKVLIIILEIVIMTLKHVLFVCSRPYP